MRDLAALTPPALVCAAFLIAVGAFLRHELRRGKSPGDAEEADDSTRVSGPESAGGAGEIPGGTSDSGEHQAR